MPEDDGGAVEAIQPLDDIAFPRLRPVRSRAIGWKVASGLRFVLGLAGTIVIAYLGVNGRPESGLDAVTAIALTVFSGLFQILGVVQRLLRHAQIRTWFATCHDGWSTFSCDSEKLSPRPRPAFLTRGRSQKRR